MRLPAATKNLLDPGPDGVLLDFSFDYPARTSDPVVVDFRVGAIEPGTIPHNDPSRPSHFSNPTVEITDSQR
jgi:hypothetical protein